MARQSVFFVSELHIIPPSICSDEVYAEKLDDAAKDKASKLLCIHIVEISIEDSTTNDCRYSE